ncbi:MAG: hypothetical protein L3K00_08735 [Thermoplasmata archaeon]|nr:hypothetical protein [Thermoplasmata archaeon]
MVSLTLLERDLALTADSFEFHLRGCHVCLIEGEMLCHEGQFFREDAEEIRVALAAYRSSEDRGRFAAAVARHQYPEGVGA